MKAIKGSCKKKKKLLLEHFLEYKCLSSKSSLFNIFYHICALQFLLDPVCCCYNEFFQYLHLLIYYDFTQANSIMIFGLQITLPWPWWAIICHLCIVPVRRRARIRNEDKSFSIFEVQSYSHKRYFKISFFHSLWHLFSGEGDKENFICLHNNKNCWTLRK